MAIDSERAPQPVSCVSHTDMRVVHDKNMVVESCCIYSRGAYDYVPQPVEIKFKNRDPFSFAFGLTFGLHLCSN